MALFVESQTRNNTLRHFCRICKKGFGCGRALGGHMRAHGIGGEDSPATQNSDFDEDEDDNDFGNDDWDAAETSNKTGNHPPSSKRMYSLRTNPSNRLRSCRACENCGKEFGSWKSFLEHGKCISGDAESLVSADSGDDRSPGGGCGNWSKRKRSFRVKVENLINHNNNTGQNNMQMCPSSEEEDLANCLMMLSNAAVDPVDAAEPEESCASASRDEMEQLRKNNTTTPTTTVSLNHFNISPTSFRVPETAITNYNNNANGNNVHKAKGVGTAAASTATTTNTKPGLFECKACKKVFNSHQALGGHRASHKKVKGCFAARLYSNEDTAAAANENSTAALNEDPQFFPMKSASNPPLLASDSGGSYGGTKRKSKAHECTICHRIFSSGQALGGHKRCHWITSNSSASMSKPGSEATTALAKFQQFQEGIEQINLAAVVAQSHANNTATTTAALVLKLDLNLPAPPTSLPETEMYLQPWIGSSSGSKRDHFRHCDNDHELGNHNTVVTDDADQFHNNGNKALNSTIITSTSSAAVMEDEAESKVKLSKLSELKDISMSEGSSWLQVGICSITDARSNVP